MLVKRCVFVKMFNESILHSYEILETYVQGSHSTWKTWKNESTPGKPGNIMEF